MKKILFSTIALATLFSCVQVAELPEMSSSATELHASTEAFDMTRTSMDENNNVIWSEGDQIVAFMKTTLRTKYQIKTGSIGSTSGSFSLVTEDNTGGDLETGQEIAHNVIVYPYSDDVVCMNNDSYIPTRSYKITAVLPDVQNYMPVSFGNGAFPMVAVSENNRLVFKNVCGGLKLKFKGVDKIKSIELEGLSNEKIAGTASIVTHVDGSEPNVSMTNNSTSRVVLDCGDGVQLEESVATTFIIALPPVTFTSGMKITITDTDGCKRVLTNSSENTIFRSSLLTFPTLTYTQTGALELPEGALESYEVLGEGGNITIPIKTNREFKVIIPEQASDWVGLIETKAMRDETITLCVEANPTVRERYAEILLSTTDDSIVKSVYIVQKGIEVPVVDVDYIDKNGVNHGKGIIVDDLIWAPVNVGASSQAEYGDYYTWIASHRACPEGWRLPYSTEFTSISKTGEWTEQYAVNGKLFYGSEKYMTSIFLPAAGSSDGNIQWGYAGYYNTANGSNTLPKYGRAFTFQRTGNSSANINLDTQSYSVRCVAVSQSEQMTSEVTINGLTWKTKNLGANKINAIGNLYNGTYAPRVCPEGWRVPTMAEYESVKQNHKWDVINGVGGYWLSGTNINANEDTGVFLPYGSWVYNSSSEGMEEQDDEIIYMTSTNDTNGYLGLRFTENGFESARMTNAAYYVPIRCVKGTLENPYINTSSVSTLPYEGGTRTIDITSNVEGFSLEIADDVASWITAEINGNQITVNVAENKAYYRYGKIRIIAHNHSNAYKDLYIYQNGWVTSFNASNYIVYRANLTVRYTGRDDQNCYKAKSLRKCSGASGVKVEMKFQLGSITGGDWYYLASSGNQYSDNTYDYFEITSNGFDLDGTSYTWSQMGVSTGTTLMTLVFDGSKGTITVNSKKTITTSKTSMSWDYLFSGYGRDSDDGVSYVDFGVPEGSKLYYVKMYDSSGKQTYIGHAAKAKNPATGKEEYCWYSNNNGKMECQFAHDSANQGGYTANF